MNTISIQLPFTLRPNKKELTWFAKTQLRQIAPEWAIYEDDENCLAIVLTEHCYHPEQFQQPFIGYVAHNIIFTGTHSVYINELTELPKHLTLKMLNEYAENAG